MVEHTHPPIKGPLVPEELMADWQDCPVCWPDDSYGEES